MQFQNDRHPWNVRALLESTATLEENSAVLYVNPARPHVAHDGDRRISTAAYPAIPQALESEERHWPLAG